MDSAKWQLATLQQLLQDRAARAKEIIAAYKPMFASKEEYLAFMDQLDRSGERIAYPDDKTARVDLA